MTLITIIDDGEATEAEFVVDGAVVRVDRATVADALGWHVEDVGLCRGDVCIPIRDDTLATAVGVSLPALAAALDRPLALDAAEGAAYFGSAPAERSAALAGLEAPGFTLPDLDGKPHSLDQHLGSKVLLAAWASW